MDRVDLNHFRQRLAEEQARFKAQIEHLNENGLGVSQSDAAAEFAMYDNHPADQGTETFEREKDLGLRANAQEQLKMIDHAHARMQEGAYGTCEECGQRIPSERLEVLPYTTLCLECKSRQEQLPDQFARPAEEKVLTPPFGRSFRDDSTYAGYDGEDAWQDVAVYGTAEGPQDVPGAITYEDLYRSMAEEGGGVEATDLIIDEDGEPLTPGDRGDSALPEEQGGSREWERRLDNPAHPLDS